VERDKGGHQTTPAPERDRKKKGHTGSSSHSQKKNRAKNLTKDEVPWKKKHKTLRKKGKGDTGSTKGPA